MLLFDQRSVSKKNGPSPRPILEALELRTLMSGDGLLASYYPFTGPSTPNLSGSPALQRVEPTVDLRGGNGVPWTAPFKDYFAAAWTGQIQPRFSEKYSFYTNSDDGVRLWVNGQQLVNNWTIHGAQFDGGQLTLSAGQKYDVRLEYFNWTGSAVTQLYWLSANQKLEVVPQSQLYSGASVANPTAPATPANLTASANENSVVSLTWSRGIGGDEATSFVVRRSLEGTNFTPIATINATSYLDTTTQPATRYYYDVSAVNSAGTSSPSSVVSIMTPALPAPVPTPTPVPQPTPVPPPAPGAGTGLLGTYYDNLDFTGATVARVDPGVDFVWDGSPLAGIAAGSFSVRWTGQVQPPFSETYTFHTTSDDGVRLWVNGQQLINNWTEHPGTINSGTISLSSGQKYDIRMEYFQNQGGAVAKLEWSSASVARQVIPAGQLFPASSDPTDPTPVPPPTPVPTVPAAPTGLSATGAVRQMNVTWNSVTDATAYNVYRGTVSGGEVLLASLVGGTSFTDSSLNNGAVYYYQVSAVNSVGESLRSSEASGQTTALPGQPTSLTATAGVRQVTLQWSAVSGATGYNVYRFDAAGNKTLVRAGLDSTEFTDINLLSGISYSFAVSATNAAGEGLLSAVVSATPTAPAPIGAPEVVSKLSAATASTTAVDISWTAAATGSAATGFQIWRSLDPLSQNDNGGWSLVGATPAGAGVSQAYTFRDSGLLPQINYFYRVVAGNPAGMSAPSAFVIGSTAPAFIDNNHPDPATTQGWSWTTPTNQVNAISNKRNNVFYVGEPITFTMGGDAQTYEVRDYYGNLVDQGRTAGNNPVTLNVAQPGWYKLYLYGSATTEKWGDSVGGSTFSIFRNDPHFPTMPPLATADGDFTASLLLTRVDSTVDFTWNDGIAAPGISADHFSARWTGQVRAKYSEQYTFYTQSDDGARLWVNGQLLIDHWDLHGLTEDKGTITLVAGQRYDIKLEYYESGGGAVARLLWSSPSQAKQVIDAGSLFATTTNPTSGGLTGQYFGTPGGVDPANDEIARGVTGMGPQRYYVEDAGNPDAAIAKLEAEIALDQKYYLPYDTYRQRKLLVAFANGTIGKLDGVRKIVEHFQDIVQYWEPRNEPNFGSTGAEFVAEAKDFYNTVHGVKNSLKVVGPGVVTIGIYGIDWCNDFFAHGGNKYIDAFSFHAYNNNNGDLWLARTSMQAMTNMLNFWGLGGVERWQTEQGYAAANNGGYTPRLQGRWTMLQMMVFEQYGVPKEQNHLWYDKSHGFWDYAMFWENEDGSLNPAASLMRVYSEELYGTKFNKAFDFGPQANNLYVGSLFTGPGADGNGKSIAAFMSGGSTDGHVQLQVKGGAGKIHVVSAFGLSMDLPVNSGLVTLPVTELPVYVELAAGQTLDVVKEDWGPDLARASGVTVTTSNATFGADKLIDGKYQNWFWEQNAASVPFTMDFNSSGPNTIEVNLPTAQTLDRMVLHASTPWQLAGSLLDFAVQVEQGGKWVTVNTVHEETRSLGAYTPSTRTTVDSYYSDRSAFAFKLATPVTTSKVRLVILSATWGGAANQQVHLSGAQSADHPTITLRELELYGS